MRSETHFPTVTIAIPAFNEAASIQAVIEGFLQQDYPGLIEILVADGGSTDGTREIVRKIADNASKVRLLENPNKTQSHGLNIMIKEAQGEIFLRADAHNIYAEDYIQVAVQSLLKSHALNVGGAQRFVAKTPFQAGVALASKSIIGNGGAKYRDENYNGYAETVFLGCFWRKTLLEIGGFSPEAVTNQDAELNVRLSKIRPNAIYVSSDVKVWYFPRGDPKRLWIQFFRYGRGRYLTSIRHPLSSPIRTKIPALGLSVLPVVLIWLTKKHGAKSTILFLLALALAPFVESLRLTIKHRTAFKNGIWRGDTERVPSLFERCLNCYISLIVMPTAYAIGGFFQMLRNRLFRIKGW